jgi:hypothetical protein
MDRLLFFVRDAGWMRKPKRMTPTIYIGPGLRLARPVIAEAGVKFARTKN